MGIRADMGVKKEGLAVLDDSVRIFEVGLAFANRLDLGSAQRDTGFELVEQEVIEACGAVHGGIAVSGGDRVAGTVFLGRLRVGVNRLPRHDERSELSC